MKIDWNFIALLIVITTGIISIASTLWKVSKLLLAKSKAEDARDQALYEIAKIQSAQIEDIMDYLIQNPEGKARFYRRKSLTSLEESAFKDYENEHTGFS